MTQPMVAIGPTTAAERDDLFRTHYGLAVSLARKFAMGASWGESIDDLTQVALLGLLRAAERYDDERGVPFSVFATTTMQGELKHHLRDRAWAVRPPRRVQDLYLRLQDAVSDLNQELGRPPTVGEIGARVAASSQDVVEAVEAGTLRKLASLDSTTGEDDRPMSGRLPATDRGIEAVDERLAVARLLAQLPERQRRMVRLRFIDGLTQNEIAERMSLSQAHVQRLLVRSLHHLRAWAAAS
jgi:RNA polymerase sigma-B factor